MNHPFGNQNQQPQFGQQGFQGQPQYGQQMGYQNPQTGYDQQFSQQPPVSQAPMRAGAGQKSANLQAVESELGQHHAFSSDVHMMMGDAKELWLMHDRGYIPLGVVIGVANMSMGVTGGIFTAVRGMGQGEMVELSRLQEDGRELALARLRTKAKELGADTVIDVIIQANHHSDVTEVTAYGTAIKQVGDSAPKSYSGVTVVVGE